MYYLNGGVGSLEALRKPLRVNRATYARSMENLKPQLMKNLIDPASRSVWFRTKQGLDVPYWTVPEYKDKDPRAPKSGLIYQPFWMTNKSRARLIQRPNLQIKPRSHVLYHLGTDEDDGLGKGFNPLKAVKRAVTFTKTSFQPKKLLGALGSITATVATGGLGPILAPKVFSANSKTMKTVGMAATAIAVVAGAVVVGPALAGALGPTLSSGATLAGKAVTGLSTFMGAFNKLSPAQQQQQSKQLTPQQIADIESGRAFFDSATGQLLYYPTNPNQGAIAPVPGVSAPLLPAPVYQPPYDPNAIGPPQVQVQEAGMFGGLSPMMLGAMIGVPLIVQLLLKERK